jgi:hypothetical protein
MRIKLLPSVVAVSLAIIATVTVYVFAYQYMSDHLVIVPDQSPVELIRVYPHQWQVDIFQPAAKVESLFTGQDIIVEQVSTVDAEA